MRDIFQSALRLPSGAKGKDARRYFGRAFEANKGLILEKVKEANDAAWIGQITNAKEWFIDSAMKYTRNKKYGDDWSGIVKMLGNSEDFKPREDRLRMNAVKGLRNNQTAFTQFRKAIGWQTKIDWNLIEMRDAETYVYGNVIISFKHSPERIEITVK